jgi:MMP 1-O-methyltransferase
VTDPLSTVLRDVPGWLTKNEADLLYSIVRDWPASGQCVELGSYQGRSTICSALALEARDRNTEQLLSIDTHTGSKEHQPGGLGFNASTLDANGIINTEPLLRNYLTSFNVSHRVHIHVNDSRDAALRFSGEVRILYVDADHELDSVRQDVEAWRKHLSPAGCILLHDVGAWPGPTIVAGELLGEGFKRVAQAGTLLVLSKASHMRGPHGWIWKRSSGPTTRG